MTHFVLIFLFYISFINSMDYEYESLNTLVNIFSPKKNQSSYKKITKLSKKLPIKLYKESQNQGKKTNHTKTILTSHLHTAFDVLPQHEINNTGSIVQHNTTSSIMQNIHLKKYHIAAISTACIFVLYFNYKRPHVIEKKYGKILGSVEFYNF